ncbi:hypothetical protein BHE74_00057665 [Ensete ventricosum]|nr:hypothetical protein BHE74_00057665 [Ensete ventricosum]
MVAGAFRTVTCSCGVIPRSFDKDFPASMAPGNHCWNPLNINGILILWGIW